MTKRPNFFIVGTPKGGTTSMYHYLLEHPDVFMPYDPIYFWVNKEPNYFNTDLQTAPYLRKHTEAEYLDMFAGAGDVSRVGEATSFYIYSSIASAGIQKFNPDAKIIIMLREPVEMLVSWHYDNLRWGHEDITDFEAALDAAAARKAGKRIPSHSAYPQLLQYRDMVAYSQHIQRYFDTFGRNNVAVYLMDDLRHDVAGVYRSACEFLDIDSDFQPNFKVHNPTEPISKWHVGHVKWTHYYYKLANRTRLLPNRSPSIVNRAYHKALLKVGELGKARLTPSTQSKLRKEFAPEVERTSALIGRDLSHWLDASRPFVPLTVKNRPLQSWQKDDGLRTPYPASA